MSDIFREVDEDLRREQARKIWDRFAPYVIGAAIVIVAATAGYRGWVYWQERQAQATGDRFLEAVQQSTDGDHEASIAELQAIAADGSGGYPSLARFRLATEKAQAGDVPGAVAEFDTIAAGNAPVEVVNLARLRAALLLADSATLADMQQRIGDLAGTGNTWRHTARELLALVAWRTGDYVEARNYYTDIMSDQESPQDIRQRAQVMLALIAAKLGDTAEATAPGATPPSPATAAPAAEAPAAADTPPATP